MANEIGLSITLRATKSGRRLLELATGSLQFDMAGDRSEEKVQDIGTSAEQFTLGSDIGTEGYAYFWNLDGTNYVELSAESAVTSPLVKLGPGQVAVFPLATGTFYGKADTAACKVKFGVIEA